jgi:hypothetical protein
MSNLPSLIAPPVVGPALPEHLAMKDGIAVVTLQDTRIFELNAGVWTQVPHSVPSTSYRLSGPDIEIHGGRILIPVVSGNSTFLVMSKVNGVWSTQGILRGQNDPHDTPKLLARLDEGRPTFTPEPISRGRVPSSTTPTTRSRMPLR